MNYHFWAGKTGLKPKQADDLLNYTRDSTRFRSEITLREYLLSNCLRNSVIHTVDLVSHERSLKEIIAYGVPESLIALEYTTRLGLPLEKSHELIQRSMQAYKANIIYNHGWFTAALFSLFPSRPEPDVVVEAFGLFCDEPVPGLDGNLQIFRDAILFGCPHRISPNDFLKQFLAGAGLEKTPPNLLPASKDGISLTKNPDSFFELQPPLVHAPQPYRITESFSQGVSDLGALATAQWGKAQEVAEGFWVFDPESKTWYSLGGKTEFDGIKARHRFVPYDISRVSRTPVLVHVHPDYFARRMEIPDEALSDPAFKSTLSAFFAAIPSCADFEAVAELIACSSSPVAPKMAIVHSLGTTEAVMSPEVETMHKMGMKYGEIRDSMLSNFDLETHGTSMLRMDPAEFVHRLMEELNKRLPSPFHLLFHPQGHGLELLL